MKPEHSTKANLRTRVGNTLPVNQPGEQEIFTLRRHPMARIRVYAFCIFVTVLITGLAFALAPGALNDGSGEQDFAVGTVVFLVTAVIAATFALIITKIHAGNNWTLTQDSLTQVEQIGLFRRRSSQLALDDVEDVTSQQNGLLAEMFNYGLLQVETAGEQGKFVFNFCPNPNYYASQILTAREAFEHHTQKMGKPSTSLSSSAAPEPEIVSYEVPGGSDGTA